MIDQTVDHAVQKTFLRVRARSKKFTGTKFRFRNFSDERKKLCVQENRRSPEALRPRGHLIVSDVPGIPISTALRAWRFRIRKRCLLWLSEPAAKIVCGRTHYACSWEVLRHSTLLTVAFSRKTSRSFNTSLTNDMLPLSGNGSVSEATFA